MSEIILTEQASGATPGAGKRTVYLRPDGMLCIKDAAGGEAVLDTSVATAAETATTIVDADKLGGRDSVTGLARLFSFSAIKTALASWMAGLLNGGTLPISATTISTKSTLLKGDTGVSAPLAYFKSADATNPSNLIVRIKGGAAQGNRAVLLDTSEENVSFGGTLALQSEGGATTVGGGLAVTGGVSTKTSGLYAADFGTYSTADTSTAITIGNLNGAVSGGGGQVAIRSNHYHAGTASSSMSLMTNSGGGLVEQVRLDTSGNLGLGVVPSVWYASGVRGLQIGPRASVASIASGDYTAVSNNWYSNVSGSDTYIETAAATTYRQTAGTHQWHTAPSGTAGAAISFVQAMTLDAAGSLLVGVASGSNHTLNKVLAEGVALVAFSTSGGFAHMAHNFYSATSGGWNSALCAYYIGKNSTTGRSINGGGTFNASGADYAEYERNNGLTFTKGSIVGFKEDGTLTNVYADAIRFAVKSTNPSYVGGDTWGSEDQVGKRPDEPQRIADKTEQVEVSAAVPATEDAPAVEAVFETRILEAGDTDEQWATKQADYTEAKAAFEAALEAARQLVDRIAYSGKVPCNVQGATPGGYIIAVDDAGAIAGEFVADPDFTQYKKAVGRVNRILPDGRCEVAVIIH